MTPLVTSRPARVVAITGGSSGLGRATARYFAAQGWRVGLMGRHRLTLDSAASELPTATAVEVVDVTDGTALAAAGDRIVAALGPIDVWINGAGNGVYAPFERVSDAEFRRVVDVTFVGTANGTRVALALMRPRGHGRIVNICSAIAYRGIPLLSAYAGAKAAVRGFTQSVRAELAHEGCAVSIGAVFPPAVNTPFFARATNHMGRPARPAPPVYQPEVIARGIYLAALCRRGEVKLSGVTVLFELATRIAPALVDLAIGRLGYEGQLVETTRRSGPVEPTMFAPATIDFGVHGTLGEESRRRSLHVSWLALIRRRRPASSRRRAPLLHPTPADAAPDRSL